MRTLQQIKDSLPAYLWLQTEQDIWREGDESYGYEYGVSDVDQGEPDWYKVTPRWFGKTVSSYIARRPIPDEVLESQAFFCMWAIVANVPARLDLDRWELHMHNGGLTASFNEGFSYRERQIGEYELHQRNGFESEAKALEAIPLLGGEQNIIKHLSQGDLYSVWSGEQLK